MTVPGSGEVRVGNEFKSSPIIDKIQELALKEINDEGKTPLARQIGPPYSAIGQTVEGIGRSKELALAGRIKSLRDEAMRIAKRYEQQNIFPGQDLEFCFGKAVSEDMFPNLPPQMVDKLTAASKAETERQKQKSQTVGMSLAIEVSPQRMLKTLLWSIKDIK